MTKKTTSHSKQSEHFKRTARELGCDESEERFNEALRTVAKHKPEPRDKASEKDKK